MYICYDLINGMSWSRWTNIHIFKFKRAPKREKPNLSIFVCYISPKGKTNAFSSSNEPLNGKN
ncbi:hypothetical protein H5410_039834 [Solanum commersonii]|uniref:Uncharacterized protein n=1 Tax=Solanum commersonii TaxID=4109 RepID=A0A9J5XQD2_SOLCO|nr:hypothetical protein H5410_039834 [Solanum commersonii]